MGMRQLLTFIFSTILVLILSILSAFLFILINSPVNYFVPNLFLYVPVLKCLIIFVIAVTYEKVVWSIWNKAGHRLNSLRLIVFFYMLLSFLLGAIVIKQSLINADISTIILAMQINSAICLYAIFLNLIYRKQNS